VEVRRFYQVNIDWLAKTLPPLPDKPDALSPDCKARRPFLRCCRAGTTLDRTAARMLAAYGAL